MEIRIATEGAHAERFVFAVVVDAPSAPWRLVRAEGTVTAGGLRTDRSHRAWLIGLPPHCSTPSNPLGFSVDTGITPLTFEVGCAAPPPGRVKVVVRAQLDAEGRDLFGLDANGTGLVNLTDAPANYSLPSWSPDGSRIAFISDWTGAPRLFVQDPASAAAPVALTEDLRDVTIPAFPLMMTAWSPDGSRLAFYSGGAIWLVNADGTGLTALNPDSQPWWPSPELSWAPDGASLAIGTSNGLAVVGVDGSDLRILGEGQRPVWSPAGQLIAFTVPVFCPTFRSPSEGWAALAGQCAGHHLRTVQRDGSAWQEIAILDDDASFAWSPDGTRLAWSDGALRVTDVAGGGTVATSVPVDGIPAWSPDGTDIMAVGDGEIHLVGAAGTGRRRVTADSILRVVTGYPAVFKPRSTW